MWERKVAIKGREKKAVGWPHCSVKKIFWCEWVIFNNRIFIYVFFLITYIVRKNIYWSLRFFFKWRQISSFFLLIKGCYEVKYGLVEFFFVFLRYFHMKKKIKNSLFRCLELLFDFQVNFIPPKMARIQLVNDALFAYYIMITEVASSSL